MYPLPRALYPRPQGATQAADRGKRGRRERPLARASFDVGVGGAAALPLATASARNHPWGTRGESTG